MNTPMTPKDMQTSEELLDAIRGMFEVETEDVLAVAVLITRGKGVTMRVAGPQRDISNLIGQMALLAIPPHTVYRA